MDLLRSVQIVFTCLVVCVVGCSTKDASEPGESLPPPKLRLGPASKALDLSSVMRDARLAFRAGAEGFRGGHTTYEATVEGHRMLLRARGAGSKSSEAFELSTVSLAGASVQTVQPQLRAGAVILDRGVAVEVLENTELGLEQSWEFDSRPPLQDESLRVRLRVCGLDFSGKSERGLHFSDPKTGLGFRYGIATWVDARGQRTTLIPRYDRGEITIEVPSELVAESAFPAVLDPVLAPELGMDTPVYGTALMAQGGGGIACAEGSCYAVWGDSRWYSAGGPDQVRGTRIDTAGNVLEPWGRVLSQSESVDSGSSAVATDGDGYLASWVEDGRLLATRVNADGDALDEPRLALEVAPKVSSAPSIAFGGGVYWVTWSSGAAGSMDVVGKRVTPSGAILDATPISISSAPNDQKDPQVAFNGTQFLVTWIDGRMTSSGLYAARLRSDGTVLDPSGIKLDDSKRYTTHALASDGTNYFVTWGQDGSPCPNTNCGTSVRALRVGSDGGLLDSAPMILAEDSTAVNDYHAPHVAFDGVNYVVTWGDEVRVSDSRVQAARVTPFGQLLDAAPGTTVTAGTGTSFPGPLIASWGSRLVVAWVDQGALSHGADVVGRFANTDLTPIGGEFRISTSANWQDQPALAFDGTNYLVVWRDKRNSAIDDIYGVRVSPTGVVLDPQGIAIATQVSYDSVPTVASNGSGFYVTWRHDKSFVHEVRGARVAPNGTVLEPGGVVIGAAQGQVDVPNVAPLGTGYLVVWENRAATEEDIHGARISSTGVVLDQPPLAISQASGVQLTPRVASNGASALVVWEDRRSTASGIHGRRVAADGSLGGDLSLVNNATAPRIVASSGGYLLVWGSGSELRGRELDGSGNLAGSEFLLTDNRFSSTSYDLAWDGAQYWAVWTSIADVNEPIFDLRLGRVGVGGVLRDPGGFVVESRVRTWLFHGALSMRGPGEGLLTYGKFAPDAPFGASRVLARVLSEKTSSGGYCSGDADCTAGFCVDGVCCDTPCSGTCEACTLALKGNGVDGACGPISANTDPEDECSDSGAASCGRDGSCDGARACRLYVAGTQCGPSICSGNESVEKECDGNGACADAVGIDCSPYVCASGACASPCSGNADCVSGYQCASGSCVVGGSAGGSGGTVGSGGSAGSGGSSGVGGAGGSPAGGSGGSGTSGGAGAANTGGTAGTGAGGSSAVGGSAGSVNAGAGGSNPGGAGGASAGGTGGSAANATGGDSATGAVGGSASSVGGAAGSIGEGGQAGSGVEARNATADNAGCACGAARKYRSRLGWLVLPGLLFIAARRRQRPRPAIGRNVR